MKTEEELIAQAEALKQVAVTAFTDTKKLHNTIDKRRTVDLNLEKASENFETNMKTNLQNLNENFMHFYEKYMSQSNILSENIRKYNIMRLFCTQ